MVWSFGGASGCDGGMRIIQTGTSLSWRTFLTFGEICKHRVYGELIEVEFIASARNPERREVSWLESKLS